MNKTIEQAIASLRGNAARYAKTERYYNGDHDLAFATEKFQNTFGTLFREFALNLCPVICDAVRDKLRVTGFSVEEQAGPRRNAGSLPASAAEGDTQAGSLRSDARRIWRRNRMGTLAGEVHKEALKNGDAYVIVWPNEQGEAAFYPNKSANMTVATDEADAGTDSLGGKGLADIGQARQAQSFLPGQDREVCHAKRSRRCPAGCWCLRPSRSDAGSLPAGDAEKDSQAGSLRSDVIPNPFGVVPVFHFANNADLGTHGRSELEAAMPVQDGLNKSVLDMLVAMEFAGYRQRWAAGIEIEYDNDGKLVAPFTAGIDHLWISDNPEARFGDFEASELDQFLKVKDSFRIDMASVTGTPLHYFLQNTSGFPSGESLKKAETRFLAKVRDRQESFGQVWADALSFALMIEGQGRAVRLITEWEDPAPMAEREFLENILLKKQIGLPVEQALLEAGYGAADVKRMITSSGVE